MTGIKHFAAKQITMGDAAVDGLLGGVLAGVAMALILVLLALAAGESPLVVFGRFDSSGQAQPLTGGLLHLATAGVYGTLFGMLWRLIDRRVSIGAGSLLIGTAYGVALFLVAETVILPGSHSMLLQVPIWQFATAHLVYGLTLGWLVHRIRVDSRQPVKSAPDGD
jgi:Family of unknown function (DUF6789)